LRSLPEQAGDRAGIWSRSNAERTKEALAVKKASGVRLGRPPTVPQPVVRRIQWLRARGLLLRANRRRAEREQGRNGSGWQAVVRPR
jgi:hypothetical protein